MLDIGNKTPFPAALFPGLDVENREFATLLVKGTFSIRDTGRVDISEEQAPVQYAPEYTGEPGASSIKYDGDAHPETPGTSVVLVGSARAGRPVQQLDVLLSAGPLRKLLRVSGDRRWDRVFGIWRVTPPSRFTEMPLLWERAFGGWDRSHPDPKKHEWEPRNPIGTGLFASRGARDPGEVALPNIEYPSDLVTRRASRPAPAGFGCLSPDWEPRRTRAGTYDAAWQRSRSPLLPRNFDVRFHESAAHDQICTRRLEGGERVSVLNATPEGRLEFALPKVSLEIELWIRSQSSVVEPVLDRVLIEPDLRRVVIEWRASFPCEGGVVYINRARVRSREGALLG
ncbi:MAG: DUF2169 domain-containing protein [Myxococcota bacterium]